MENKKIWLAMMLAFVMAVAGCNKKAAVVVPPGTMDLSIKNDTGEVVEKAVIKPSGADAYMQTARMEKGGSYTVFLPKSDSYAIILIDSKGHHYGKENIQWAEGAAELQVTKKDFISQGLWDSIKKTIGL